VDLLAIGHQGVTRQRIVMLPARQLADATNRGVHGAQSRTVALPPDHAFMIGRRDLASTLDQGSVRIEQQLRIIECTTIALVDADGHHHSCLPAGIAYGVRGGRWRSHGLIDQPQMFLAEVQLKGRLHERK
jgi:hypothetical protein